MRVASFPMNFFNVTMKNIKISQNNKGTKIYIYKKKQKVNLPAKLFPEFHYIT